MKHTFLIISFIFFTSLNVLGCNCSYEWNDSFSRTAKNSDFLALVKVISFDEFLEDNVLGNETKMPSSMTVEIIKKYKGIEQRKKIKILGDNGMLCRPYLSDFEINGYYLISPKPLDNLINTEYDFYTCRTDFLKVDMVSKMAYGKYSMFRNQISLKTFENKLKNGDWDLLILGLIVSLLILILIILSKNKKNYLQDCHKMFIFD